MSDNLKLTPGPWGYVRSGEGGAIMSKNGLVVCDASNPDPEHRSQEEHDANMRVMGASKQMYAVLGWVKDYFGKHGCPQDLGRVVSMAVLMAEEYHIDK